MPHPTKIGWCDFASNPIRARNKETGRVGHYCEPIRAGCANCYASRMQSPYLSGVPFSPKNRDKVDIYLDETELGRLATAKAISGKRVFVEDMSDLFGDWVPDEWLDRLFGVFTVRPDVTWCLLTKRVERVVEYLDDPIRRSFLIFQAAARTGELPVEDSMLGPMDVTPGWPLENVWLGVSCSTQKDVDEMIPTLLQIPASVLAVSLEPLVEAVDVTEIVLSNRVLYPLTGRIGTLDRGDSYQHGSGINWVIVGGESGPGRRPFGVHWARDIHDQCKAAGVPFYMKQDSGPKPGTQGRIPDELWAVKEFPEMKARASR